MNRRADASIVVLVLLSVVLLGAALFIFNTNNTKIVSEIKDVRSLNGIYLNEERIDFYINEAIDMTIKNGYSDANGFSEGIRENLREFNRPDISVSSDLLRIADEPNAINVQIENEIVVSVNTKIVDKTGEIITTKDYMGLFIR